MMKRRVWKVDTDSVRPAGKPDECFYCNAKLGEDHRKGCVMRSRTVMVEIKATLILSVPEDWDASMIEFDMNDSSSCFDNLLNRAQEQAERVGCSCGFGEGTFLREATEEDEAEFKMKVADAES
jgi:hypothetical protein